MKTVVRIISHFDLRMLHRLLGKLVNRTVRVKGAIKLKDLKSSKDKI